MKRLYALILTIAIVFSISVAPAHAAVSAGAVIEGVLAGLGVSSITQTVGTFWNWATASAEEKHNALRDGNDSWYNLSRSQILQYSVIVSADDLYSLALELNRLGMPCRIASGNFDDLGYGSVGTLWYIQGTGQMIDKYGNLLGTLSYDGESFATNINGKNFGDGLSRVGQTASPPRVFVARSDCSSAYLTTLDTNVQHIYFDLWNFWNGGMSSLPGKLDAILDSLADPQDATRGIGETVKYINEKTETVDYNVSQVLSSLGTTNNLLSSINDRLANLSGVGGGGSSTSSVNNGNYYYCCCDLPPIDTKSSMVTITALSALVSVLSNPTNQLDIIWSDGHSTGSVLTPYSVQMEYVQDAGWAIYISNFYVSGWLCTRDYDGTYHLVHVPSYIAENSSLLTIRQTLSSMDSRLQNISTELVALDAEVVGLGVFLADIDLGINSLVASNAAINTAVASINSAINLPVEGTNALLLRILNNIKDVEDLVGSSLSISDDLITEIDTNWVDNLDAFRDDIVYNLYLFEGVYSMPNVTFSRDDIVDYFEGWCSPNA